MHRQSGENLPRRRQSVGSWPAHRALRLVAAATLLCAPLFAAAMPPFLDTFIELYKPSKTTPLFKAECMLCHTVKGGGKNNLNPYGLDVKSAMTVTRAGEVTAQLLANLESKDSDHDGATNIQEIEAGFLPGDSTSHPPPKKGQPDITKSPKPNELASMIPTHSFHPLAVHFPIALFIFGAFLEIVGKLRRNTELRRFALWNLGFGALASLIAIPTGIAAWLRVGFSLEGNLLVHFILALAASILMLAVAQWRRSGEHDSRVYWMTLAITVMAVAAAGHFGSLMVYG